MIKMPIKMIAEAALVLNSHNPEHLSPEDSDLLYAGKVYKSAFTYLDIHFTSLRLENEREFKKELKIRTDKFDNYMEDANKLFNDIEGLINCEVNFRRSYVERLRMRLKIFRLRFDKKDGYK